MAVGLTGIGQMGAGFWTIPLFYGGTLLVAVGLSGYAARRLRTSAAAARQLARHACSASLLPDAGRWCGGHRSMTRATGTTCVFPAVSSRPFLREELPCTATARPLQAS